MDGYWAHCIFRSLQLLKENNIIAIGRPAHSSRRAQVLDYSVFSPFKNNFCNLLNERTLQNGANWNDIYTICKILNDAYTFSVRYTNIVIGFAACGIWDNQSRGPNPNVISQFDITSIGDQEDHKNAYTSYFELVNDYTSSRNLRRADGEVIENGTLHTRAGALLTS